LASPSPLPLVHRSATPSRRAGVRSLLLPPLASPAFPLAALLCIITIAETFPDLRLAQFVCLLLATAPTPLAWRGSGSGRVGSGRVESRDWATPGATRIGGAAACFLRQGRAWMVRGLDPRNC
jgi:hypothetical protein